MLVFVDLETRSAADLPRTGVYRYSEDPSFRILCAGWSEDGGPVDVTEGHNASLERFLKYDEAGAEFVAWNAGFDRICLSAAAGGPYHDPARWHDPSAVAAELGRPRGLGACAEAFGASPKDTAGRRLINLFSKPRADGAWNDASSHPNEWNDLLAYCATDVEVLVELHAHLRKFPTRMERRIWVAGERINDRGLRIDRPLAVAAARAAKHCRAWYRDRMSELTDLVNPNSTVRLLEWLRWRLGEEVAVPDLQIGTVDALLALEGLPADVGGVLELRREAALTAVGKFDAALAATSTDGRVRGSLKFFGAHTGRWSGRGLQLQNLPRDGYPVEEEAMKILDLLTGSPRELVLCSDLKRLVRPLVLGPLTVVDFGAIEARVTAWLAGETWALEAFRAGRDIYVEAAARMGPGYTRTHGKVATLALGFGGGPRALANAGADGDDDELAELVASWRATNQRIVRLWGRLGEALGSGGQVGHLEVRRGGATAGVRLPGGRALYYRGLRYDRWEITDPLDPEAAPIQKSGYRYADSNTKRRIPLYGGKLTENCVQAIARDLLAEALVRLEDRGFVVVGHVHDEVLVEGTHDVEEIAAIMCEAPPWAPDLPMAAAGFVADRYRK